MGNPALVLHLKKQGPIRNIPRLKVLDSDERDNTILCFYQ